MRNITFMEQKTENNHKGSIAGKMDLAETSGDNKEQRIKVEAISTGQTTGAIIVSSGLLCKRHWQPGSLWTPRGWGIAVHPQKDLPLYYPGTRVTFHQHHTLLKPHSSNYSTGTYPSNPSSMTAPHASASQAPELLLPQASQHPRSWSCCCSKSIYVPDPGSVLAPQVPAHLPLVPLLPWRHEENPFSHDISIGQLPYEVDPYSSNPCSRANCIHTHTGSHVCMQWNIIQP